MAPKTPFRGAADVILVTVFFVVATVVILAAVLARFAGIGF